VSQSFGAFLDRIGQIPVLTKEQEVALAKRIERGGPDGELAKQTLVEHNIRLAVSVARRYTSADVPLEDLVQEAVIGLHRAAEKFDWRRNLKFSTYAVWWIRHMIQRALYRDRATIRVPGHVTARKRALEKYMRENPEEGIEEAASSIDISVEAAQEALASSRVVASLDAPYPGDEGGDRYGTIADETAPDPSDVAEDRHPGLTDALASLDPLERRVLELRFGFEGDAPKSRDQVADILGVRPHVVQRSQRTGLEKLRKQLTTTEAELEAAVAV
jgi:RNA polymerase primary sigma factor